MLQSDVEATGRKGSEQLEKQVEKLTAGLQKAARFSGSLCKRFQTDCRYNTPPTAQRRAPRITLPVFIMVATLSRPVSLMGLGLVHLWHKP